MFPQCHAALLVTAFEEALKKHSETQDKTVFCVFAVVLHQDLGNDD